MSTHALSHVWNAQGVTATQKLVLIWLANNTADLGQPVYPEWHGMADFACYDWQDGPDILREMSESGLIYWPAGEGYVYVAYDGPYNDERDHGEPKGRQRRIEALIERDGSACRYCHQSFPYYHIDHVIPRSRGGADVLDNLVLACPPCNLSKGARTPEEWNAGK